MDAGRRYIALAIAGGLATVWLMLAVGGIALAAGPLAVVGGALVARRVWAMTAAVDQAETQKAWLRALPVAIAGVLIVLTPLAVTAFVAAVGWGTGVYASAALHSRAARK